MNDWKRWEEPIRQFLANQAAGDVAHDAAHIERVVASAAALASDERADLCIVLPAAWLHDCVSVAKDSPDRPRASAMAAATASDFLAAIGYEAALLPAIAHAIAAHSFSAQIAPQTAEAKVVQDADRLDSLGAIGVARCLMLGGALGRQLYHPDAPFPSAPPPAGRAPDDTAYTIDHFYVKLLHLADTMQTAAGRREATRRTAVMQRYLDDLRRELG